MAKKKNGEQTEKIESQEPTADNKPQPIAGNSLSEFNKELKKEAKTTRTLDSQSKKDYAVSRMITALEKRGWTKREDGLFVLKNHSLAINKDKFEADVDGYNLPLGAGALKVLDQYVSLAQGE